MAMSRKLVPAFLTLGFTVLLSGAAFARHAPQLAAEEDAANRVLGHCSQPGTGYRAMSALAAKRAKSAPAYTAVRRRMADHSVITCAGESLHTGGGYRDIFVRFEPETSTSMVACLQAR
jgi:hypothetical protein